MLSPNQIKQLYGTKVPNQFDLIRQPVWERKTFTSASTTQLSFFAASVADKALGFVEAANTIPSPKSFLLYGVKILIVPGVNPSVSGTTVPPVGSFTNDVFLISYSKSYAELIIGNKQYLQVGPIGVIPSGAGLSGFAASAYTLASAANQGNIIDAATNGIPDAKNMWYMDPPLLIDSMMNFSFTLNWSATQTLSANAEIIVYFDGQYIRPQQ